MLHIISTPISSRLGIVREAIYKVCLFVIYSFALDWLRKVQHTVSHVTLLVSSGKFMGGSAFFLSPPENKKAKFAFCTLKRKGGSTQKQPFLTVQFRGALLTKSVTLEFSQGTVWLVNTLMRTLMKYNIFLAVCWLNLYERYMQDLRSRRPWRVRLVIFSSYVEEWEYQFVCLEVW